MQLPLIDYLTAAGRRFARRPVASITRAKARPRLLERSTLGLPDSLPSSVRASGEAVCDQAVVPTQVQELLDFFQGELEEVSAC